MMTLLVRREILIPRWAGQSFQAAAVPDAPLDSWMGIYLSNGEKIGFMHSTSNPELRDGEEGARLGLTVTMRTKILGEVTPVKIEGDAWASATDGLRDFDFSVRSGDHEGGIKAVIRDGVLDATFELDGEPFPIEWTVDKDLFLWSGMGASNLYFPTMEEGDEFFVDAFDPVTMSKSPVLIRCVGTEEFAIGDDIFTAKVVDMEYDTMTARAYIDAATGEVLRAETPLGITLQRINPGEITQDLSSDEAAELFGLTSVQAEGLSPRRGIERMVFRITGLDEWTVIPSGETQRAVEGEENTFEIVVPKPFMGTLNSAVAQEVNNTFPESFPEELAERLAGATTNWDQIQYITEFVSAEQQSSDGELSINILTAAAGGAIERAGRFAQLARAVGIEVRVVSGLVWVGQDSGFQYHAWPEVRFDRWYWVDPLLAQLPADATHIQLSDSAELWTQLMRLLPKLQIEVLEVE